MYVFDAPRGNLQGAHSQGYQVLEVTTFWMAEELQPGPLPELGKLQGLQCGQLPLRLAGCCFEVPTGIFVPACIYHL